MKVALVNPPQIWGMKPLEKGRAPAIEYLASLVESKNYKVDVINAFKYRLKLNDLLSILLSGNYDVIGITSIDATLDSVVELCNSLNEFKGHLCLGGYGATFWSKELLQKNKRIDSIVIGEGELTFLELLNKLKNNEDWTNISGIAYLKDGVYNRTKPRELISDLDAIPFPVRRDTTDVEMINSSRGCYANCSFCNIINFYKESPGERIRIRDPRKVVEEIETTIGKWQEYLLFSDDNFLGIDKKNPGWIDTFISEIKRRKLNFIFFIQTRPNDLKEDVLIKLYEVGLRYVGLGIESNCKRMLKDFRKGTTPEINLNAIKLLKKLRITHNVYFILFDPFTTIDEIQTNLDFLEEIDYCSNPVHFRKPVSTFPKIIAFPGSDIFKEYMQKGIITKHGYSYDWEFVNSNLSEFYQVLTKWKDEVAFNFINAESIILSRFFRANNQLGITRNIYHLSRKFIKIDLKFMNALVQYYKANPNNLDSPFQLIESFKDESNAIIEKLYEYKQNMHNQALAHEKIV